MIFSSLAKFIKPHLKSEKPILNLLPLWMRDKLIQNPAKDNVSKVIQAEFLLKELDYDKKFFIVPKSPRAENLLKFLKEYIYLMESTRFSRWLAEVEPNDFSKKMKDHK
ncbi:MAG: hypothetical protein QNJ31_06555 [Candidatus Caenarcaniphilales bacterium]|nr:hypothetical protein [Candidatus Caenarcaniphilales bacterium]